MTNQLKIVGKAIYDPTARPNELARTMAPHQLIHQELPYDPEYFVYNRRLATSSMVGQYLSACVVISSEAHLKTTLSKFMPAAFHT